MNNTVALWSGIATIVVVLAPALRWVHRTWRTLERVERLLDGSGGHSGLRDWMDSTDQRLASIEKEFRPNSGSSQKDQLNRVERLLQRALAPGSQPPGAEGASQ